MTTLRDAQAEPATLVDVLDYLQFELQSVELDPAESNFQRGYEYALRSYRQILVTAEPVRRRRLRADGRSAWR